MKNISIVIYTLATLMLMLQVGCATSDLEREQKAQIRSQAPADSPQQIMDRAAMAFSNAPGLTVEQKAKLGTIYSQVYTEAMSIRREMGQAKSLLFMKLATTDYKNSEIISLKKRIVKLDQRRLDVMFKALEDVQNVVGHGADAKELYKHFEDFEIPAAVRQKYEVE